MRFLFVALLVAACATGGTYRLDPRLNDDNYVALCVVNRSVEAYRVYYENGRPLGSVYPGEKRWVFLTYDFASNVNLYALDSTGNRDLMAHTANMQTMSKWEWTLDNNPNTSYLALEARERTSCDK